MSSNLPSELEYFRLSAYANFSLATAVIYDHCLTFSKEMEYVWTLDAGIYVIRFSPISVSVSGFGFGTLSQSFFPQYCRSTIFLVLRNWVFLMFVASVDLMMIMRVYAIWGRSKIVLTTLLCVYVPDVILIFVFAGNFSIPNNYFSVTLTQISSMSVCAQWYHTPAPLWAYQSPGFFFAVVLLFFALIQTSRQTLEMYRETKKWEPNRYMKLLVRDGVVYYFLRSTYDMLWTAQNADGNLTSPVILFLYTSVMTLLFVMPPRFIVSIRELYDRGHRGPLQSIDTGFGVSQPFAMTESATVFTEEEGRR